MKGDLRSRFSRDALTTVPVAMSVDPTPMLDRPVGSSGADVIGRGALWLFTYPNELAETLSVD